MTPPDKEWVRASRKALGMTTKALAEALRLGRNGGRTVRRWESGETPISGPAQVAIELMLSAEIFKIADAPE